MTGRKFGKERRKSLFETWAIVDTKEGSSNVKFKLPWGMSGLCVCSKNALFWKSSFFGDADTWGQWNEWKKDVITFLSSSSLIILECVIQSCWKLVDLDLGLHLWFSQCWGWKIILGCLDPVDIVENVSAPRKMLGLLAFAISSWFCYADVFWKEKKNHAHTTSYSQVTNEYNLSHSALHGYTPQFHGMIAEGLWGVKTITL